LAQEAEYLTGFDGEGDIIYSSPAVESAGESRHLDCVHDTLTNNDIL